MSLNFGGSLIATDDNAYLKVNDVKDIADNLLKDNEAAKKAAGPIVQKLDNKWIQFSQDGLESEDDDQLSCALNAMDEFVGNEENQKQLLDIYSNNSFVTVQSELGTQKIGDNTSRGYQLGIDNGKVKGFGEAAESMSAAKKLADCLKEDEEKANDSDDITKSEPTATVKLWADQWTHKLTRLEVLVEGGDFGKLEFTINTILDQPVEVTVPATDVTPVKDIEADLQTLMLILLFSGALNDLEGFSLT
jgi:hypothetical protein